jgi:hypothetical protein
MANLPGITTSWTRNPPKECLFRREIPAQERGIHLKNVYFAGNNQLRDKDPPVEWYFARNDQLIDEESTREREFRRELPANLR